MNCVGFSTSQGSIYAVNAEGKTVRYKNSSGDGQYEVQEPCMCLFVSPQAMASFEAYWFGFGYLTNSIRLGMIDHTRTFKAFVRDVSVPEGYKPYLIIVERDTGKVLSNGKAQIDPDINLIPVEKRYDANGTSWTHVGHPVAKIYTNPKQLIKAAHKAGAPKEFIEVIGYKHPINKLFEQFRNQIITITRRSTPSRNPQLKTAANLPPARPRQ